METTGKATSSPSKKVTSCTTPRGIRNNNPLNIRKGSNWYGERHPQADPCFEEFESMELGIRAAFKLLRNYITGFSGRSVKFNTIRKIVRRWAPPTENATQRYIDFVCKTTGLDQNEVVWFSNRNQMVLILRAMAFVECGQWIDIDKFYTAYDMLL